MIRYNKDIKRSLIKMVNPTKSGLTYTTYWRIINNQYVDMKMILKLMDIFNLNKIEDIIYYEKD